MDAGKFSCGVFVDLKKAFDTVDHSILLQKLAHYGFRGLINVWFRSYLQERAQVTMVGNRSSNKSLITCGVPQGSVLYRTSITAQKHGTSAARAQLNERALRFVYRDYSSSYEMLLKQSGYQTLLNQRLAKILTTVYKVVNGQGVSESLCDLVELRESNYNLQGDKILTLPKVNTTKYGLKSLRYEGANLWNKLPKVV